MVKITDGSVEYHEGIAHPGFSDPLPRPTVKAIIR